MQRLFIYAEGYYPLGPGGAMILTIAVRTLRRYRVGGPESWTWLNGLAVSRISDLHIKMWRGSWFILPSDQWLCISGSVMIVL
jgi:hypothetical protein